MSRFKSLLLRAGLLGSLLGFAHGTAFANPEAGTSAALRGPEQRIALVIGNSKYQNAPQLANPDNDAQSMAQLLNSAGFEVIAATDLTQNDMIKVVQDFSAKVSSRGPNTVAMVYYAGHGVQLAGENYLVPVDARISTPADLANNAIRLVDVMGTLETIPSRIRIVVLDACRNNPFPGVNDAGRGLAIVDAPNGSIVAYSTAPGSEARDGANGHSPYTQAFLRVAREPNLPIEQLFKRVRLEVNNATDGQQIPWESSSLTSDFYFFGDTAVAATRAPDRSPVVQIASNLPSRSVRQAYDYVLSEGSPQHYQEFIRLFPNDPLCDRVRALLGNLVQAQAWHKTVLANSPVAYKSFYDNYGNSPYAQSALKLQSQPKNVPLMQFTHLMKPQQAGPLFKPTNVGLSKDNSGINGGQLHGGNLGGLGDKLQNGKLDGKIGGRIVHMPSGVMPKQPTDMPSSAPKKIVTLPAPGTSTTASGNKGAGKIVTMPVSTAGKAGSNPVVKQNNPPNRIVRRDPGVMKINNNPPQGGRLQNNNSIGKIGGGNASPHFAQSMGQGRRGFH